MQNATIKVITATDPGAARYDIIGDVHGCFAELSTIMADAGWIIDNIPEDDAVFDATHPDGRLLIFAGDLTDRGPGSDLVLRLAMGMIERGHALWVVGNHDDKFSRYLKGNSIQINDGLRSTIDQIENWSIERRSELAVLIRSLPIQIRLPMPANHPRAGDGFMTVVHGAAPEHHIDQDNKTARSRALYGYPEGKMRPDGTIARVFWAENYKGVRWVLHGHERFLKPYIENNVIGLDTGCVFGNALTLYRADSCTFLSVAAQENYFGESRDLCLAQDRESD
jgi:protein phosphatase